VTTYVNPMRVHWLIGELGSTGINEIKVVEYFKPRFEISRVDLLCEDLVVERVCRVIHEIGTTGGLPDHCIFVNEFERKPAAFPELGKKMGDLDE
ncbi:MAG: hypothetical protein B7Z63_02295, partial [Ignavibacteriae bacterium 37-53-5]